MKKNFLFILFAAAVFAACQSGNTNNAQVLDACGCAKEELNAEKNADTMKKCEESRKADAKFEADFQKCLVAARAGLDTSKVSVGEMDPTKGLDLPAAGDGVYNIVPASSSVKWLAKKVTGQHNGSVMVKSGSIDMAGGNIRSGQLVIDMTTIKVEDLTGDPKNDLEGHLKSEDFFSIDKNKEAIFTMKSSTMTNKHQFEVTGDLTIKGIKKEAKMTVLAIPSGDRNLSLNGGFAIDRTAYDIKYRSAKFFSDLGDKMIEDTFVLTFDLKASK